MGGGVQASDPRTPRAQLCSASSTRRTRLAALRLVEVGHADESAPDAPEHRRAREHAFDGVVEGGGRGGLRRQRHHRGRHERRGERRLPLRLRDLRRRAAAPRPRNRPRPPPARARPPHHRPRHLRPRPRPSALSLPPLPPPPPPRRLYLPASSIPPSAPPSGSPAREPRALIGRAGISKPRAGAGPQVWPGRSSGLAWAELRSGLGGPQVWPGRPRGGAGLRLPEGLPDDFEVTLHQSCPVARPA